MSKMSDFFTKVMESEEYSDKVDKLLEKGMTPETEKNIISIAKKLGITITAQDIKEYYSERELDDEDLSMVAGGVGFLSNFFKKISFMPLGGDGASKK